MLEKVDLNKSVDKENYKKLREEMDVKLGELQRACKAEKIPVVIVFDGFGAGGKGTQINRLIQPLDPRGFDVYASRETGEEERMRPFLWRYWTKTPEDGRMMIFDKSWYDKVTVDRFDKETKRQELNGAFRDILSFEKQLADSGMILIKLFLYISRDEQKKRFKRLEESKETAWRVTEADWKRNKDYDTFLEMNEEMLQRTDTGYAPWTIVEATDKNYAAVKILSTVTDRLEYELNRRRMEREEGAVHPPVKLPDERFKNGVLSGVDLTKTLTREEYKERLDKLQKKLEVLHGELYRLRIPVVIGFEGWDAAGKGGAIRRLTSHLDPRGYKVNPTAAPNDVEKVHHYLWRFWREMPKAGHIAIFDRTWYGRVMVERIEGFCSEADWKRAYQEINEMEEHMANFGAVIVKFWIHIDKDEQERRFKERMEDPAKQWKITDEDWRNREKWDEMPKAGHIAIFDRTWYGRVMVERIEGFCSEADWKRAYQEINEMEEHMANFGAVIVKFWIHIDKDEQERRFKERMEDPAKQWKITDEDWRNREKWDAYEQAVNEMLVRTSTTYAPWTIIEGNSKYFARVKVLETVVEAMEEKIREVKKLRK